MMKWRVEKQSFGGDLKVLISLVVLAFTLWLIKFYWDKRRFLKLASQIPGPEDVPVFGVAASFIRKSIDESFKSFLHYYETSPELFKFWFGHLLFVGVSKPEHLEVIMNHPDALNKSPLVDFTKPYMGDGLFSAPADIWKRHRKLLNPVFKQKALDTFIPIFSEKCEILIGKLEKHTGQPNVDINEMLSGCTLDTICETGMGLTLDLQTSNSRYGKLLEKAMEIVTERIFNVFYYSNKIFCMSPMGKQFGLLVDELNEFSNKVISKKKTDFEQKMNGDYIEEKDDNHIKSFLELLLEISHNGNKFTELEIRDEVNTFIAAGSDTTAVALSFCCMTLGMHPEYQQKIYEEAIEVLGQDRYATKEDLKKLKFTEMFIKETLRLFPIAPLLVRIASGDIKIDDLVIPEGSVMMMGVLHLHRNPKYWENPLKFDPYRFSPEEWAKKHPYSYLPFSRGPRICFGYRYAMMIMKVILSKIVRKFEMKTDYTSIEEIQLKMNVMIRPTNGFKVTLELRE